MPRDLDVAPVDPQQLQRRQSWRLTFVLVLIWVILASRSEADAPCQFSLQYDGFTPAPLDPMGCVMEAPCAGAGWSPSSVQLLAELANFDSDVQADGWQAVVVLTRRDGTPLAGLWESPVSARFDLLGVEQLVEQRAFHDPWLDERSIASWTLPLSFDSAGTARVALPVSQPIQRSLGWQSLGWQSLGWQSLGWQSLGWQSLGWQGIETLHRGTRAASDHVRDPRNRRVGGGRPTHFVTQNVRDQIDFPAFGWLRVRVMVPGQGSFAALAPVALRP